MSKKTVEIETQIVNDIDSNTIIETVTTTIELNEEPLINTQDNNNTVMEVADPPTTAWEKSPSDDLIATEEKLSNLKLESDVKVEENLIDLPMEADVTSEEMVDVKSSVDVPPEDVAPPSVAATNGHEDLIDVSNTTEQEQWKHFEDQMKETQGDKSSQEISNEEAKMWKLAEGKVELSECF